MTKHYKPNVAYELLIDGKYKYYGCHCRNKKFLYESEIRMLSGNIISRLLNKGMIDSYEFNDRVKTLYIWEFDNPEEALEMERFLILQGKFLYGNLCLNVNIGNNKSFRMSEMTKEKIKEKVKEKFESSPELKAKCAEWGRIGGGLSPSNDWKKAIIQYKDGLMIAEYESIREASRQTGLEHRGIAKAASGKRKTCGGFHWEFKPIGSSRKNTPPAI